MDPAPAGVEGPAFGVEGLSLPLDAEPARRLDAELARLAALPLGERGAGLAELAGRLEAELDATNAPLRDG